MILNNYNTIQFIVQHRYGSLTEESLLHIHRLITEKTLDDKTNVGHFRENNNVVVADMTNGAIVYTPPTYKDISEFVKTLCEFFNDSNSSVFIHPIIRGIIIHFMLAYIHPFVDGNGRTARALFYWYMLKNDYKLTEYMSISRVIARSKTVMKRLFNILKTMTMI